MRIPFVWKLKIWGEELGYFFRWARARWECLKWGHVFKDEGRRHCDRCDGYYGYYF